MRHSNERLHSKPMLHSNEMIHSKDRHSHLKAYATMETQPSWYRGDRGDSKEEIGGSRQRCDTSPCRRITLESRYSRDPYLQQETDSKPHPNRTEVHRNREEVQQVQARPLLTETQPFEQHYESFQADILRKVECIEAQTNHMLQTKEKELEQMSIQLQANQSRLIEAERALAFRDKQITRLNQELQLLCRPANSYLQAPTFRHLEQENSQLKDTLRQVMAQNESWKGQQRRDRDRESSMTQTVDSLKQEVQQLQTMVSEMERLVHKCPSCFSLGRSLEEVQQAYAFLQNQHSQVKQTMKSKEVDLLQSITVKIEENQNILRENTNILLENTHLKHEKRGARMGQGYYMQPRRERAKESVAKRCRTLTDYF